MIGWTEYETVKTWMKSAGFDGDEERLGALEEYCHLVGQTPDEIIATCLKQVGDGQFKLKLKTRTKYAHLIDQFQQGPGGQRRGNYVRSFFIHNGVMLTSSILR
jgi:hypothetical protein